MLREALLKKNALSDPPLNRSKADICRLIIDKSVKMRLATFRYKKLPFLGVNYYFLLLLGDHLVITS